jgi:chaperonin cofactor prefoldin
MPRADALDTLMAAMAAEYERQKKYLDGVADRLQKEIESTAERVARLKERIQRVMEDGRDDDGEAINPDIEEALDHLENEGMSDLEDLEGAVEAVGTSQGDVDRRLSELNDIIAATPTEAFFLVPVEEDAEDEDNED